MTPLQIFIGYDRREPIAFSVLVHSILRHAARPVTVTALVQAHLRTGGLYTRAVNPLETTEFSFTRFLVPYLSGYRGFALFMDSDMLARADVADLLLYALADPGRAVYVCPHDYTPKGTTKFLGQPQTAYPKKNHSSLMLFDCRRCEALTPDYVNTASGLALHRFQWLRDDQIGTLPLTWNWLVDEYATNPSAHCLHYTNGGPWFPETADCDHAADWLAEYAHLTGAAQAP